MVADVLKSVGLALLICSVAVHCQLSKPIAYDDHVSTEGNKFLQRKAEEDAFTGFDLENPNNICPQNVQLRWMTEVSSSIYATPLITDLYSDGRKDIIVPSFVHYLEVLEGADGAKSVGWPAFHKSTLHTSPLLFDIDFDGVRDIMIATYNGEILFFKDTGELLTHKIQIPRLNVKKNWYVGLSENYIDHSHPDVGSGDPPENTFAKAAGVHAHATQQQANKASKDNTVAADDEELRKSLDEMDPKKPASTISAPPPPPTSGSDPAASAVQADLQRRIKEYMEHILKYREKHGDEAIRKVLAEVKVTHAEFYALLMPQLEEEIRLQDAKAHKGQGQAAAGTTEEATHGKQRRLMMADDSLPAATPQQPAVVELDDHELSDAAQEAFHSFDDDIITGADLAAAGGDEAVHDPEDPVPTSLGGSDIAAPKTAPGDDDMALDEYDELGARLGKLEKQVGMETGPYDGLFDDDDDYPEDAIPKGSKYWKDENAWMPGGSWEEETYHQEQHKFTADTVSVDPHLLCTPAIADIDGDGHDELIVAVSYFFDREYYDDPAHSKELHGIDPSKYIASGVVVFDLTNKMMKWSVHLDLSTESTLYKAYMYSSPTVVDLDGDGKMEIVVGTSMGFLYVLQHDGTSRLGWPIQMGEIQGQPLVADVNGDGNLEIFAADSRGSIALFSIDGKEIWERHIRSMISQMATAGDINGDGELEIVFGTANGNIYAVDGPTGEDVHHFPFKTRGKITAPVLLTQLSSDTSLQLVVMSFDGHLYIVNGISGCGDTVDIGETSYSMVLADDLDGNGKMDLIVATMNGVVYSFETPADYHPLSSWTSQVQGPNGMVARQNWYGVFAEISSRRPRDVAGEKLQVKITVVDKRGITTRNGSRIGPMPGPYNVSVLLKGVGVKEMNAGLQPVIGVADTMIKPGSYVVEVPCPRTRSTATVQVVMQDVHGLSFVDEFSISFHVHFHKLLKWFITLPLGLMIILILMIKRDPTEDPALPSFHYED